MKRKKVSKYLIVIVLTVFSQHIIKAQQGIERIVKNEEVEVMIDSIVKLVEANYISEEIGQKVGKHIKRQQVKGIYKNLSFKELGRYLTRDMRESSGDLHMSAFYNELKETSKENLLDYKLGVNGERSNYGFVETIMMKPNLGYLKIAHFTSPQYLQEAKHIINHSMAILQNVDALIIDVRDNPGGFEEIVAYFISYFFESKPFLLQEYYARNMNRTTSISTTDDIPGKKLAKTPIYILTNKNTGSAAESFAYIMKHLKRAQIIGETTAGAGNGASNFSVSNEFMVQIATVETINKITKTSWEKVGVTPTINTTSDMAIEKALQLAKIVAQEYKAEKINNYKNLLTKVEKAIEEYPTNSTDEMVVNAIIACHKEGLFNESQINSYGYLFMREQSQLKLAEIIFKANTLLYPKSPNVFDSYAEALSLNGNKKLAIINYSRAVELARESNDENLELFIKNLEKERLKH